MNRCKTCQWWDELPSEDEYGDSRPRVGLCFHRKMDATINNCTADHAYIEHAGPEFGCVHHEEK